MLIELGAHDQHGHYLTIPGLLTQNSIGAIAGAIAPRPQRGADALTPPAAVAKAFAETSAAYARAGAAGALELFVEPCVRHRETPAMRQKVLRFFAEQLQAPKVGR